MFIRGYLGRAEIELRLPRPDASIVRDNYGKAIALNPADVGVRTDYAVALEHLGDPAAAADELDAALHANAGLGPEEPKRLTAKQVDDLAARIRRLRATAPPR